MVLIPAGYPETMAPVPVTPALTVDGVWIERGRILLVRRRFPPFEGRWALPGGFVEVGETVEAAVRREVKEETGLSPAGVALLGVYSDPSRDPRRHTVSVAYLFRGRALVPTGGSDARAAAWVPLRGLPPLAFDHGRIVADALRVGRRRRITPRARSARTRRRSYA